MLTSLITTLAIALTTVASPLTVNAFASSPAPAVSASVSDPITSSVAQPAAQTFDLQPQTRDVQGLNNAIHERVRAFNGISGIAIHSVDGGWEAGWRTERLFPQQSVSKMWVSLAVMDAYDRGELDLTKRVTLGRNDLTLWSSATRAKILGGGYTRTLDQLMYDALVSSDNHANDFLLRELGGPEAIRSVLSDKGIDDVRFGDGERLMQAKIAGLEWNPSYSLGNNFSRARSRLPASQRSAAFNAYVEDPYDGASPMALARALARLERGELLSPASTAKLLTTMGLAKTGRLRVKSSLKPGWTWIHKTGTGQNFRGRVGGLNDVGLLTAPDGSSYAIAVMTIPNATDGSAQELMRDIGAMVIAHHERYERSDYTL